MCPVSKEISTKKDNPPCLLVCGHLISKASLNKMTRGQKTQKFKCPTCPTEMIMEKVVEINIM